MLSFTSQQLPKNSLKGPTAVEILLKDKMGKYSIPITPTALSEFSWQRNLQRHKDGEHFQYDSVSAS